MAAIHRRAPTAAILVALLVSGIFVARAVVASRADVSAGAGSGGAITFATGTAAADQRAVLDAIASARPQAQRVMATVTGLVDVRVAPTGLTGSVGTTQRVGGRYTVTLDLATVSRFGARGISRLVLHELGHVVDGALVDPALAAELDARIPAGWGCVGDNRGACATREERFAESFAKWSTGDIGMNLLLGYAVAPPSDLDGWGRPLAELVER